MTAWVENTDPTVTWKGASAERGRLYGIGRYGIRAYGQGSALSASGFQENTVAATAFTET